jgi:hypothetical protein
MGYASLQGDIVERRSENNARVIFDDLNVPPVFGQPINKEDPKIAKMAKALNMTPAELIAAREWIQRVTKECNERLAREMTMVFRLSKDYSRIVEARYLSKAEASEYGLVIGGDLLDLDARYGGMLVRSGYVFISEKLLAEGLSKYEPADLLNGLIAERKAA